MKIFSKLSIKAKMTLLSSFLMFLNALIVITVATILSNNILQGVSARELSDIATKAASQVIYKDGVIKYSEDFRFVHNGVYTLVLAHDGMVMAGSYPVSSGVDIGVPTMGSRQVSLAAGSYYVVDVPIVNSSSKDRMWVRVMESVATADNIGHFLLRFLLVLMPIFVVISTLSSYFVAKKSFSPIKGILDASNNIRNGVDLSQRINIGEGDDEIHQLAHSFDEMFERLDTSFKRERQFTSDASHELRTPTSVILAQCDYLEKYGEDLEEYQEGISTIKQQSYTMRDIIESMLTLSRMDQSPQAVVKTDFDVSQKLHNLIDEAAKSLPNLVTERDIEPNVTINGNPTLFSHAINNILSNASKYGNNYALISLNVQDNNCVISIRDKGQGIPEKDLENIWNRFYQTDPSRSGKKGYGLGLALVQEVVGLHDGSAWVLNHPEGGCIFYIKLPI